LYQDIESAFLVFQKNDGTYFSFEEINGSRVKKRTCEVMDDLSHLSTEFQWKGLSRIVMIETQTYLKSEDKTRSEKRFYITSKESSAKNYLTISRNHWAIESNLHWSLDLIFGEDKTWKNC
jgi:predicted transposase YbfD/YdcC